MSSLDFYKTYKTLCDMLYKRGHNKIEIPDYETFKNISRHDLSIKSKCRPDYKIQSDQINVYFPEDEKVGVKPIRSYINEMTEEGINHAILIIKDGITPFAKSEIITLMASDINIEIFTEKELIFDITEHELVPKHELMTSEEKEKLLSDFGIKDTQLPKILVTDPVARYYGLKKKDIVKITRPSEVAGIYINYRVVI